MRLLKLGANKDSFKSVEFNRTGLTLIVGQRSDESKFEDKQSTYNSVGKSLIISLIHFCLASRQIEEFELKLNDWIFYLEFEINGVNYISSRACDNQKFISLNGVEMKVLDFTDSLFEKTFDYDEKIGFLTYRSLISRFVRPNKAGYIKYDTYVSDEKPYQRLFCNSFLLGLDPVLINNKYQLKQELDQTEELKRLLPKDPILKLFFEKDKESGATEIADLKQRIQRVSKNLENYQIAEDYYSVRREADKYKITKKDFELKATKLRNTISQIEKSLELQPDIASQTIIDVFNQAKASLNDLVVKTLQDVEEFNKKLVENRRKRLLSDRSTYIKQLHQVEDSVKRAGVLMEEKLQYLNGKGALEDYNLMGQQLKDMEIRLHKMETYRNLLEEYRVKVLELKQAFSSQNLEAHRYLTSNSLLLDKNLMIFKNLVSEMYGESKKAGIEITVDDGENQNRFNIKAKIEDDRGDGVSAVKMFCYDWTVLRGQHNHNVKFLFHDSRLLSEIDSHQLSTLFRIAYRNTTDLSLQYIISSNQNILDGLKYEMDVEEYSQIIEENIKLKLTDESDVSKLLGMQIDLDYER